MSWGQDTDIEVAFGYEGGVQVEYEYDPDAFIDVPLDLDPLIVIESPSFLIVE
jgi:hypothetical protein